MSDMMDFTNSIDRPAFTEQRAAMERTIARHVARHGHDTLSLAHFESALPPTTYIYEPSFCVSVHDSKRVVFGDAQ